MMVIKRSSPERSISIQLSDNDDDDELVPPDIQRLNYNLTNIL